MIFFEQFFFYWKASIRINACQRWLVPNIQHVFKYIEFLKCMLIFSAASISGSLQNIYCIILYIVYIDRYIDRQKDRQTDRQIDRQIDRQTDRQTDRQIDRQQIDRWIQEGTYNDSI